MVQIGEQGKKLKISQLYKELQVIHDRTSTIALAGIGSNSEAHECRHDSDKQTGMADNFP